MARYLRRRRAARQQPSTPAAAASDPASAGHGPGDAARPPVGDGGVAQVNERYSTAAPTAQNQLDLFKGAWTSAVPVPEEVTASGPRADLFDDGRIEWAIGRLGPLAGKRVLELGPLEAGHTMMLERAGADVVAIEAHSGAFLRCLVVKNLLDLRARFLFGDFLPHLRKSEEHFDAVVASGVLYHMTRPVELLHLLARHTDRLFVWTHYWHGGLAEERPDVAARFEGTDVDEAGGYRCKVHRYAYREGPAAETFCGGTVPNAAWMERHDILASLASWGFRDVEVSFDEPFAPHGPAFAFVARRSV